MAVCGGERWLVYKCPNLSHLVSGVSTRMYSGMYGSNTVWVTCIGKREGGRGRVRA